MNFLINLRRQHITIKTWINKHVNRNGLLIITTLQEIRKLIINIIESTCYRDQTPKTYGPFASTHADNQQPQEQLKAQEAWEQDQKKAEKFQSD